MQVVPGLCHSHCPSPHCRDGGTSSIPTAEQLLMESEVEHEAPVSVSVPLHQAEACSAEDEELLITPVVLRMSCSPQ